MNPFNYHTPETQEEALALLHEHGDSAKLMAGGTALVIMMKQRLVLPETLISLHRLRGLAEVQEIDGTLRLGALLTHRAAETSPETALFCSVTVVPNAPSTTLRFLRLLWAVPLPHHMAGDA